MDLRHDWKALNEVLFQGADLPAAASSLVLLEDEGKVIDGVVSNGRAFSDIGTPDVARNKETLDALATKYSADQTIVLSKKTLDQFVIEAAGLGTNYFQQLQTLRSKVLDQVGRKRGGLIVSRRHFLLDLLSSGLRRVLPRRFNVLVFIDNAPADVSAGGAPFSYRALLLSYSSGQLDQFFEPDFSSLHENRLKNWHNESDAIGQYLESRYILPCYGLFMHENEWEHCLVAASQGRKPWRMFVRSHDNGRAAVYPDGFLTKSLLGGQRMMLYFGRV